MGPFTPPDEWVLQIGDTLHNMRVALDYLAFRLVTKHTPDADVTKIAFPICIDAANYASVEGRNLNGAPTKARAIIKTMQPHYGGRDSDPLFLLDALENVHKHRHLLAAYPALTSFRWDDPTNSIKVTSSGNSISPLVDGAEVARYVFTDPSNPQPDAQFKANFHIAFDKNGPARGTIVLRVLRLIHNHVGNFIFPQLEPFL